MYIIVSNNLVLQFTWETLIYEAAANDIGLLLDVRDKEPSNSLSFVLG